MSTFDQRGQSVNQQVNGGAERIIRLARIYRLTFLQRVQAQNEGRQDDVINLARAEDQARTALFEALADYEGTV